MAVDDDGVETEGLEPLAVDLHVVLQGGWLALTETVYVEDGA